MSKKFERHTGTEFIQVPTATKSYRGTTYRYRYRTLNMVIKIVTVYSTPMANDTGKKGTGMKKRIYNRQPASRSPANCRLSALHSQLRPKNSGGHSQMPHLYMPTTLQRGKFSVPTAPLRPSNGTGTTAFLPSTTAMT